MTTITPGVGLCQSFGTGKRAAAALANMGFEMCGDIRSLSALVRQNGRAHQLLRKFAPRPTSPRLWTTRSRFGGNSHKRGKIARPRHKP